MSLFWGCNRYAIAQTFTMLSIAGLLENRNVDSAQLRAYYRYIGNDTKELP